MRVAFLHPDLGLGGAERLVVDAAVELVQAGHTVDVYTAYYDKSRCFEETITGGFRVIVAGSWFPSHVGGRFMALCAYMRCILVAIHIAWVSRKPQDAYDVTIVDQVAVAIPVLRWFTATRILFYCHHPDLLLTQRKSLLKRVYRAPLDWVEQVTTGMAHRTLVNSRYTQEVFSNTFKRLHARGLHPEVLHPAVAVPTDGQLQTSQETWRGHLGEPLSAWVDKGPLLLSINRFERKKGIGLAIQALHELGQQHANVGGRATRSRQQAPAQVVQLLVAGGWDARLPENVEHLEELKQLVADLDLQDRVRFLPSFTDGQRAALLAACTAVVYTPENEHFGIVPIEAMASGKPVVAVNSGGPLESVAHGTTGLLCDPTPAAFASAYHQLLDEGATAARRMGAAARLRAQEHFSRRAFGVQLNRHVHEVVANTGAH